MAFCAQEVKDRCVAWIRDFFDKNGRGCNCIIGISGGKDSSVAAALCVEALGRERVLGVLMPNGEQADIDMARKLVEFLGIESVTVNIAPVVQAVTRGVESALNEDMRVQATVNIPVEVAYTDANGVEGVATGTISVNEDVLLYVPAPSIMPFKVVAEASAVAAEGSFNSEGGTFTINACVTVILKVAIDVELLIPSYGYCAIPPAQDYSKEVCAGFFELPLYPQGKNCNCK